MYVHVHGARRPDDLMYSSILFVGRRVWDVTHSPPSWNNTILGVPILRNTYTIYTSKISKFCRSILRSIIYFQLPGPSPLASTSFSCWFSSFGSSPCLGTLWLLPSWCSLVGKFRRNDVLRISNISLVASSLPAQFPLSLHAWNVSWRIAWMNVPSLNHFPCLYGLPLEGFLPPFANQ